MQARTRRWLLRGTWTLVAIMLLLGAALWIGAQELRGRVAAMLGPGATIGAMYAGPTGLLLEDVHMPAPPGWPAGDAASVQSVRVVPELRSLFSGTPRMRSIEVQQAQLVLMRSRAGIQLLPGVVHAGDGGEHGPARGADLSSVTLHHSTLIWVDQTVPHPPLTLELRDLDIAIADLDVPALQQHTQVRADGTLHGPRHDGAVHVEGWIQLATLDSDLKLRLHQVDLDSVQPYLERDPAQGAQHGLLDLDTESRIDRRRLRAPGSIRLSQLSFSPGASSFLGAPRAATLKYFEQAHDHLDLNYVVEGDLDNPKFSLNDSIATKVALAAGETLGVSIVDVAKGVTTLGSRSVDAVKGIGSGVGHLLGIAGERKKDDERK
ncbi:MAG TPA: DUF748 domain-containing protein [Nevskiaceae bacterium]|nr:DUF748 domain-containing protein [Nevskiaceae bacterium]